MTTRGKGKSGAAKHQQTEEEKLIMEEGVSLSQLGRIFAKDKRTVSATLKGLTPCGERMGFPIYNLADAASRLAVPDEDRVIEIIKRLKPSQLPVKIQKEFWDSARSRQRYLEGQGDLWRTDDIIDALLEAFKTFRQSVNLMSDVVARETEITDKQRRIINELSDTLLVEVRRSLLEEPVFAEIGNVLTRDSEEEDIEDIFDQLEDAVADADDEGDFLDE